MDCIFKALYLQFDKNIHYTHLLYLNHALNELSLKCNLLVNLMLCHASKKDVKFHSSHIILFPQ